MKVPVVPESLQPFVTEEFLDEVDRFAHRNLDYFIRSMPDPGLYSRYSQGSEYSAMSVPVMRPRNDYDPTHGVFVLYPFQNGHVPYMHMRNLLMQSAIGNDKQLVCFPNNNTKQEYYWPTPKQLDTIASGDATPLAAGMLAVAQELRLETIDVIAYSQGPFVAAALLKLAQHRGEIRVKKALIADPTNVVDRTDKELRRDFIRTGLFKLRRAVKDSAIPALVEAQNMHIAGAGRFVGGMLEVSKSAKLPVNAALHSGMTYNTLLSDLEQVRAESDGVLDFDLLLARAEKSRVTPKSDSYEQAARFIAKRNITIEGYGHEAADNISGVFAPLARAALLDLHAG